MENVKLNELVRTTLATLRMHKEHSLSKDIYSRNVYVNINTGKLIFLPTYHYTLDGKYEFIAQMEEGRSFGYAKRVILNSLVSTIAESRSAYGEWGERVLRNNDFLEPLVEAYILTEKVLGDQQNENHI